MSRRQLSPEYICDCDNKPDKSAKGEKEDRRQSFEKSTLDSDTVLPNLDSIMDEIKHKKCAVVELVRQQIARFSDEDEGGRGIMRSTDEDSAKKALRYLTIAAISLLLFALLYALLCGSCCVGGSRGKRCWLFARSWSSCHKSYHASTLRGAI